MVWITNVMIAIRGDVAGREGEVVLMRGYYASVVQWMLNYNVRKNDVRTGA